MRVLITGSFGFVGRNLLMACKTRGDDVTAIDLHNGSDAMTFFLGSRIQREHYDLVLHCAAYVDGRRGIDGSPAHMHSYNTMLDAAMFQFALRHRPGRVVYFSSSAAYPVAGQGPDATEPLCEGLIDFSILLAPEASYGRVKLHGEQMAADVRAAGVPVTVLRPFSGYGSDQSLDYPFPSFIARAKAREDPFDIWGSGDQLRDWIHIDDIVAATLAAVEQGIDGPVNLCTGVGTSFYHLAVMMAKIVGYRPVYRHLNDRPAGVDYRVGDPTRLYEFFTPQVGLIEGIQRALMA